MKKKDLYKIIQKIVKEQRGRGNEIDPIDAEPLDFDDVRDPEVPPPPDPGGTNYGTYAQYYCTADSSTTAKYAGTFTINDKFCCDGVSNNGAVSSGMFAGGVDLSIQGHPNNEDYCLGLWIGIGNGTYPPPPTTAPPDCTVGNLAANWTAWVAASGWPWTGNIVTDTGAAIANTPNTAFGPYASLQAARMNCCPGKNDPATNPNGTCRGCRISGNDNYGSGYTMSSNSTSCVTYDCDSSVALGYVSVTGLGGTHANAAAAAAACASTTVYGCTTAGDCNEDTNATANDPLYCVGVPTGGCESCGTDSSAVNATYNPSGNVVVSSVGVVGGCSCDVPGSGNYDPSNLGCPDSNNDPDPGNTSCCTPAGPPACMTIRAVQCNSHQIPGQQFVTTTICATIGGQTPQVGDTYMEGNGVPYMTFLPNGEEFVNHSGYIDYEVIEAFMPEVPAGAPQPVQVDLPVGMCPRPLPSKGLTPIKKQADMVNPFTSEIPGGIDGIDIMGDEEKEIKEVQVSKKLRALFEEEFSLNEEKKLRKLIRKILKRK